MNNNLTEEEYGSTLPAKQPIGRGQETPVAKEDLIIPRAMLLQYLPPKSLDTEHIPGEIVNSLTDEILPAIFVPVFYFFNWIRFNPRKIGEPGYDTNFEAGAMIWRSDDPNDPKVVEEAKFGPNGEKPLATKFINFFSYFEGQDMPVVISFSSSSYKVGKKLLTLTQFPPGLDVFSRQYSLTSKATKNDKGDFFIPVVTPKGKTSEESFVIAETWYNMYKGKAVEVHSQAEQETEVTE